MRLFISYRRKTWPFTERLAKRLRRRLRGRVFFDLDSVDESDFQNSILRHLRESDAFLLVVSPETFDPARIHQEDDWVRREVAEALRLDLPIVLALIDGHMVPSPDDLPEDIRAVVRHHGIEFYARFFDAGVAELARFIRHATPTSKRFGTPLLMGLAALGLVVVAGLLILTGVIDARQEATETPATGQDVAEATTVPSPTPSHSPEVTDAPTSTSLPTMTPTPVSLVIDASTIDSVLPTRTLEGHTDAVGALAWSPDGSVLASGSNDGKVILWNLETDTPLRTLQGHREGERVDFVAFSPNGAFFATAGSDGKVIIWDTETGQPRGTISGYAAAWSPDNTTLATSQGVSRAYDIYLWNVQSYGQEGNLSGHDAHVDSMSFSPDGSLLASGDQNGSVRLWDVEREQHLYSLSGHAREVNSVSWSPDGSVVASASGDGRVILWHPETGLPLRTLAGHTNTVTDISWSPDSSMLASGGAEGTLILWDAEAGMPLREWEGLRQAVYSVAWSPDGMVIATGSEDGTIVLWEVVPD